MIKLLRSFILRPMLADRLRSGLTVLSVALGVAVVVAIDLAGEAAVGSFSSSLEAVLGTADLSVSANGAVDERYAGVIARLPVNLTLSPVIESQGYIAGFGAVTVFGIDPVGRPMGGESGEPVEGPSAFVSSALARRAKLQRRAALAISLAGQRRTFTVAGVVQSKDAEFVLLDIADAQAALGRADIDRIEVQVAPGSDIARVEGAIRAAVPPAYSVERAGARGEESQRMLRAFRWNLRVLSYISLVVGAFLIYNTISVSVVRRRAEIGVLRAIGTSRRTVLALFLSEAAMFGVAGAAIGVVFGRGMAEGAVGLISQTVNSLYTSSRPGAIELTWTAVAAGVIAGVAMAILSALGPAVEAMRVTPVSAMGRGVHEERARLRWLLDLGIAGVLAAVSIAAAMPGPVGGRPVWGYVSALSAIVSAAMAAPAFVLAMDRVTRAALRRMFGAAGMVAGRGLAAALARTSVVVAALATAIAMMVAVGIMVASFRETVLVWLDAQLRADLFVRAVGRASPGSFPPLRRAVIEKIRGVAGIADVDVFHGLEFRIDGLRATLGAGDLDVMRRHGRMLFLSGDRDAILRSVVGTDRAIVSEPFANKHGVRTGDRLKLPLGARDVEFEVAGIYYEYSSELGYVILDSATLKKYLPDQPATNMAVYLQPGADRDRVRAEIRQRTAADGVLVADNQTLRAGAVAIFDRTFAITWALEGVAIFVAMLGAANSLLALVLDRRREIGMLRFLGASPAQVRQMVLVEAGLVGLLAAVLGLAMGFSLSQLLIHVINKQSFGWTIQFHPPIALLAIAVSLIWAATVAAALYPARVAARLDPIEAVSSE